MRLVKEDTLRLPRNALRVEARDRRTAALHEAGHIVMARHFRFPCEASVWPHHEQNGQTLGEDRIWLGRTEISSRVIFKSGAVKIKTPTRKQHRMIAVAGSVAQNLWRYRHLDDQGFLDLNCGEFIDDISDSDWHLLQLDPFKQTTQFFRLVVNAAMILRPNTGALWPQLIRVSRELIDARPQRVNFGAQ
jgi:hypothetical protein